MKQFHKDLFDSDVLAELAPSAGFATSIVFRYCYPDETWPVNLALCRFRRSLCPNRWSDSGGGSST